jgi:hypothetical protein
MLLKYNMWANGRVASPLMRLRPWRLGGQPSRRKTHHGPPYGLLEASQTRAPPRESRLGYPTEGRAQRAWTVSDTGLRGDMHNHGLGGPQS